MGWPNKVETAVIYMREVAARQAAEAKNTTAVDVPVVEGDILYPYSGLQQAGFFILFFFPSVAFLIVALRIWSRLSNNQFGWDDALITAAMACSIAETGASYMGMRTAYLGVHFDDIPPTADPILGMQWNYILQLLYNPILALVKSSVLLFLLRLGGQKPGVRWTIHGLNFFNIGLMIAIFITVIFQCTPIAYFWDRTIEGGTCINTGAFYIATAGLTILTDILVLILPFWIFLGLKMPSNIKIALLVVFGLGAVVTVISILRLVWLVEISFYPGDDPTYDIRFTYSAVETNLAIICASAPALRGLFIKWFPQFFSSLWYGSKKYGESGNWYSNRYGSRYGKGARGRIASLAKRGQESSITRSYHQPTGNGTYKLQDMSGVGAKNPSTNTSEEEIMTYNGIMRTTQVDVVYDSKNIASTSGSGAAVSDPERLGNTHQAHGTRFGYD